MSITDQSSSPAVAPQASAGPAAGPACLDLRAIFGDRYKIGRDESLAAEHGERGRTNDPWLLVVVCRWGHVYIHGANRLGVATSSRGSAARAIASLPGVELLQDGDDGINAAFPVELFDQVAAIIKPRRRRRLSLEHRKRLVAMGKANLNMVNSAHVGCTAKARIRPIAAAGDQGHPRATSVAVA